MCEVLFLGFAEVIDVIARSWWVYKKDLESKTGKELVIAEKQEPGEHYNHWTVNPFSPTQFTELFASISFLRNRWHEESHREYGTNSGESPVLHSQFPLTKPYPQCAHQTRA
jgi:hypothetical protein